VRTRTRVAEVSASLGVREDVTRYGRFAYRFAYGFALAAVLSSFGTNTESFAAGMVASASVFLIVPLVQGLLAVIVLKHFVPRFGKRLLVPTRSPAEAEVVVDRLRKAIAPPRGPYRDGSGPQGSA